MKYKVLIDYGSEGRSFMGQTREGDDFYNIDEAVKAALAFNSASPFIIVSVIDWQATQKA